MTLFSISLLGEHPSSVDLMGMGHNLFWVTLGNVVSGSLFMGYAYWVYSGEHQKDCQEDKVDSERCKVESEESEVESEESKVESEESEVTFEKETINKR